jgi:hypothetical protein
MLIVCLLTVPSTTDERIHKLTKGASPQDDLVAVSGPIGFDATYLNSSYPKRAVV